MTMLTAAPSTGQDDLPPPIPELPAPPGDPSRLAELAGLAAGAAGKLKHTGGGIAGAAGELRTAWQLGPGRHVAIAALDRDGTAVDVESAVCDLAAAALRGYTDAMRTVQAAYARWQDRIGCWNRDLAVARSQCPDGTIPAPVRSYVRALHVRRTELLSDHQRLSRAATAAAERAATEFQRATNLTAADLPHLSNQTRHATGTDPGGEPTADPLLNPPRMPNLDIGTALYSPHPETEPYTPGTGSIVAMMPMPFPRGGGGTSRGIPGAPGGGPQPGGGYARPGGAGRAGRGGEPPRGSGGKLPEAPRPTPREIPRPVGTPKKVDDKWLARNGIDAHAEKDGLPNPSYLDIYKDRVGNLYLVRKGAHPNKGTWIGNVTDFQ